MSQITKEKFLEIHREYKHRLYAISEKILRDHHRVEDVIQDVFLRLQKQDFSKIENHITQWLFTVCRNCSLKQYHKRNRYVFVDDMDELDIIDESTPSVSEKMDLVVLSKVVKRLTKKLTKNQQKALKLKYTKDCSYDDIAKKLKTTSGNVGFMLSTAISKLKKLVNKENLKKNYY